MSIPHWRDGTWDRIRLGGKLLAGRVHSLVVTPARSVQQVKSKGEDGPQLKDEGYTGATVDLVQEVWTGPLPIGDSQLDELAGQLFELSPKRPGAPATPLDIMHPITGAAGVANVYVVSYTIAMPEAGGRLRIPIKMLEWFPPEATKPTQQSGSSKHGTGIPEGDGGPIDSGYVPPPDPENLGGDFP